MHSLLSKRRPWRFPTRPLTTMTAGLAFSYGSVYMDPPRAFRLWTCTRLFSCTPVASERLAPPRHAEPRPVVHSPITNLRLAHLAGLLPMPCSAPTTPPMLPAWPVTPRQPPNFAQCVQREQFQQQEPRVIVRLPNHLALVGSAAPWPFVLHPSWTCCNGSLHLICQLSVPPCLRRSVSYLASEVVDAHTRGPDDHTVVNHRTSGTVTIAGQRRHSLGVLPLLRSYRLTSFRDVEGLQESRLLFHLEVPNASETGSSPYSSSSFSVLSDP